MVDDHYENEIEKEYFELMQKMNNKLIDSQRELVKAKQRADEACTAKDDFLARMSHDMRTPINAIKGFNEIIREQIVDTGTDESQDILNYLDYSDQSADFLLSLINDILDLSKINNDSIELDRNPFRVSHCFYGVDKMVSTQASNKGLVYTHNNKIDDDLWCIGDEIRIQQVLMNLLNNAIKFTDVGKSIDFSAEQYVDDSGNAKLIFSVKDTGIGMSVEFQKKMFDPFEQERNNNSKDSSGAGLGLAIAKRLLDSMNGKIEVNSHEGEGTEFKVTIDLKVADKMKSTQTYSTPYDTDLTGRKAIVCDDNGINRLILKQLLEKRGCIIIEAENGKECLDKFKESQIDDIDVILMDVRMPIMDGLEAAAAIRTLKREDAAIVPIIALSANAYDEDVRLSEKAGMNIHLTKPIDINELVKAIVILLTKQ